MIPFALCLSENLWRVQMLFWFVGDNFCMVVGHFFENHTVSWELVFHVRPCFMQSPRLLTDKDLCEGVIDGWKQLAALFLKNTWLFFNYSKARKALTERQKDLEMKTQQLEVKLSNKTEEEIKKARRKSTQAGEYLCLSAARGEHSPAGLSWGATAHPPACFLFFNIVATKSKRTVLQICLVFSPLKKQVQFFKVRRHKLMILIIGVRTVKGGWIVLLFCLLYRAWLPFQVLSPWETSRCIYFFGTCLVYGVLFLKLDLSLFMYKDLLAPKRTGWIWALDLGIKPLGKV